MSKVQQAIRPNYFKPIQEIKKISESKIEEEVELRNERVLSSLGSHEGWEILKRYIEDRYKVLDDMVAQAIGTGATLEEIGQRTILAQLAKDILKTIIDKVEDAKEAGD